MLKDLAFAFILCLSIFEVPCVGVSIGIERIFSILEAKAEVIYNFHVYYNVGRMRGGLMEAGKSLSGREKFGPG